MEQITSIKNPRVQLWRSLKDRRARLETGLFLVEGFKSVRDALASSFEPSVLLATEEALPALTPPAGVPVALLPEHVLAAVCDTKTPQGVAAVMRMRAATVAGPRLIALDGVQDPGNVGTILRTADAAGFSGVLLSRDCADPYAPKTLRATMGSVFHVPFEICEDLAGALAARRAEGFAVLSAELDGTPFARYRAGGRPLVLVIGSEGNGVSPAVRAVADEHLSLPMRGGAESLNAAVAAGILMYALMEEA